MPILAGLISSFFGMVAGLIATRFAIGIAAAGAFVVTSAAAYAAVKAALYAASAALSAVAPPSIVAAVGYFLPGNLSACLAAIILADTINASYQFWRSNIGPAVSLARG